MVEDVSRRQVLATTGTGTLALLAGCFGDDDESGDDSSGGQNDDLGQSDASETNDSGQSDASETDGDDTEVGETEELAEDLTAADVLAEDEVNGFVADLEFDGMPGQQVAHGSDFHITMDVGDVELEMYQVGNEAYEVNPDGCFVRSVNDSEIRELGIGFVPIEPFGAMDPAEVPVVGTTTIDGESVYVAELDFSTTYISAETGYRVREEGHVLTADFHSWGETDPISPPNVECQRAD